MIYFLLLLIVIGFFVGSPVYWIVLAIVSVGYLIAYSIEKASLRQSSAILQNRNTFDLDVNDVTESHKVENWDIEEFDKSGEIELSDEELWQGAIKLVAEAQVASSSMLQRKLHIGYVRAARLLEKMEEDGLIGSADGKHPRKVLMKKPSEVRNN